MISRKSKHLSPQSECAHVFMCLCLCVRVTVFLWLTSTSGAAPVTGTPVNFIFVSTNPSSSSVTLPSAATINGQTVSSSFMTNPGAYSLTYITDDGHIDWPWTGFTLSVVLQTSSPLVVFTAAPVASPTYAVWQPDAVPSSLLGLGRQCWLQLTATGPASAVVVAMGDTTPAALVRLLVITAVPVIGGDYRTRTLNVSDVTSAAGFPTAFAVSAAAGDIDGDGDDDVILLLTSSVMVLVNNGSGAYTDGSAASGVSLTLVAPVAVLLFDGNGDGALDLLVVASASQSAFFVNNGSGVFVDGSLSRLQTSLVGNYVAAAWADFDVDGDVDVLVVGAANYFNVLLVNNGTGYFVSDASARGVAGDLSTSYAVTVADVNRSELGELCAGDDSSTEWRRGTRRCSLYDCDRYRC